MTPERKKAWVCLPCNSRSNTSKQVSAKTLHTTTKRHYNKKTTRKVETVINSSPVASTAPSKAIKSPTPTTVLAREGSNELGDGSIMLPAQQPSNNEQPNMTIKVTTHLTPTTVLAREGSNELRDGSIMFSAQQPSNNEQHNITKATTSTYIVPTSILSPPPAPSAYAIVQNIMQPNEIDNVTIRRRRNIPSTSFNNVSRKNLSLTSISDTTEDSPNKTHFSLPPNMSYDSSLQNAELEETISRLETELRIAHEEIEQLNCEIIDLKKKLLHWEHKIKMYKSVGFDDLSFHDSINNSTPKFKGRRSSKTKNKQQRFACAHSGPLPGTEVNHANMSTSTMTPQSHHAPSAEGGDVGTSVPPPSNDQPSHITQLLTLSHNKKNTIFILGDEQISGLSKSIYMSRLERRENQYIPTTIIKRNATSFHVLNYCNSIQKSATEDDVVIICTGNSDTNPYATLTNVSVASPYINYRLQM